MARRTKAQKKSASRTSSAKSSTAKKKNDRRGPKKSPTRRAKKIQIITDSTAGLPRHFLAAILSQFPGRKAAPTYHLFCDSSDKIERVFRKSVKANSLVFHAVSDSNNKSLVIELATSANVPHFDLTGDAITFLAEQTGWQPTNNVGFVQANDAEYLDRMDAWEFTMQHDDSRRLDTIDEADIVLVGLSRVSKTPTAAYLGWLGHRVANVSLVPEMGLPKEVEKCKGRVVALTSQPKRLAEIRARRMEMNGFADAIRDRPGLDFRYSGLRDTIREVMAAEAIYKRMCFPVIDVTDATVEETAARVLEITAI